MLAVGEVGAEKVGGVFVEVEAVLQVVEEYVMIDGVVRFGEVEKNGECWAPRFFVQRNFVKNRLEGEGAVRVRTEGEVVGGYEVVCEEVGHELFID